MHQLRKSIAIIPQEPNLFEGTVSISRELIIITTFSFTRALFFQVRSNLDWLQEHTDGDNDEPLWEVHIFVKAKLTPVVHAVYSTRRTQTSSFTVQDVYTEMHNTRTHAHMHSRRCAQPS